MLTVAAGLIVRYSKLLVCQRHRNDSHGLLWEFPGGKVEEGETPAEALVRELREELGVEATIGREIFRTTHRYKQFDEELELIFFVAKIQDDAIPQNLVFERLDWTDFSVLPLYDFLDADKELIRLLASGAIRVE